jgi:alginate O-acetyltransferase complex protein AlgI
MLFNSVEYIFFFLPATLIVYFFLNSRRLIKAATAWLVFASLFFYSWWNIKYLALIIGSILFNFAVGTGLSRWSKAQGTGRSRKTVLIFGIIGNIVLLGYYKYTGFLVGNIAMLGGFHWIVPKIILPLGISFFTFTQIAYLVDTYGEKAREYDFLNYALFVTFFPHLLAGPIIHHKEMMPQFGSLRNKVFSYRNMSHALFLFFLGLFKKVIIADALARIANTGFDSSATLSFLDAWITSISYTLQIYFDFSAYTDMALAASLMFNIRLPINFNSPYKALDITDFWRRWHMTLSRFLRDYVYIPLGGNRAGRKRTYYNLLSTFLIGGLWHGAGWTFIFWGFLHGAATVIHRIWSGLHLRMPRVLAWFLTFNFVNAAWVFFRAKTWHDAVKILRSMFALNGIEVTSEFGKLGIYFGSLVYMHVNRNILYVLAFLLALAVFAKNTNELSQSFRPNWRNGLVIIIVAAYSLLSIHNVTEFLYFNF